MVEKKSEFRGEPKPEKLLLRKIVFEGRAMKVRVDTVLGADGRRSTREVVERNDCIAVVAVDADDNVLLVNQFRTPLWKNLLEIPAGGIEKGENVETAVVREMREETGFKPAKVVRFCGFFFSPGYSNEYCHLYLATDLTHDPLQAEDTPGIELVKIPVVDIMPAITSGRIQDGKSIAGLLYYLEWKKNVPVQNIPVDNETGADNKVTLEKEWDEFYLLPFPERPKDEALADLYADLVLEDGEIAGIVKSFLQGKKVDKKLIYINEDLSKKLQNYRPSDSASRLSLQDLIARKKRLDKLAKLVLELYDK
jgi:ADP-ribose pyrophosphatase